MSANGKRTCPECDGVLKPAPVVLVMTHAPPGGQGWMYCPRCEVLYGTVKILTPQPAKFIVLKIEKVTEETP